MEVSWLVDSRIVVVRKTYRLGDQIQCGNEHHRNVLEPATPVPLSMPAMWLKTTSRSSCDHHEP